MNEDGTVIEMTGDPHLAISIAGQNAIKVDGPSTTIADAYVPSGSSSLSVRDAALFHVGDRVQITRPVRPEWLHQMGMDTLWIPDELLSTVFLGSRAVRAGIETLCQPTSLHNERFRAH